MAKASLIYIHGFLSSPMSHKAQVTKSWLETNRPEVEFFAPKLPPYPEETGRILQDRVESLTGPIYLMGSSLGGFWATFLAEKYDLPVIVVNPACKPQTLLPDYVGKPLQNYHTQDTYELASHHIAELEAFDVAVSRTNNYWLMAQTNDETLDYRQAVEKYQRARQLIEEGGNHSFEGFETHLSDCMKFFDQFYVQRT